ncbi:MAG: glycosyltransferase family 9 protein [Alphaproteobacteria bacterium]|nr:glycosyltransferase family 9 protein [Alphaproteobacteria bacterium]
MPASLLFITSTRLGDAVLSTGVLSRCLEQLPEARVIVATGPVAAPVFRHVPGIERVHILVKQPAGAHWLGLWAQSVMRRWDLVVDLRGSAMAYLVLASRRLVLGKGRRREHRVEELGRLIAPEAPPPAPRLWLGSAERAKAASLIPDGGPVLALGPAANWRAKTWRAERFAQLALRLTGAAPLVNARVAIFGAPGEEAAVGHVLEALPAGRRIDLVGKLDPLEVAACLERCRLFVGNDSGLMHMSAAVGVPTVGLFGPSPVEHYRPWGRWTAVARTPEMPEQLMAAPGWDHRTSDTLMDSLSVDEVERVTRELMNRVGA